MPIASVNPATGETLRTFQPHSPTQIDEKLRLAAQAFRNYQGVPFVERARLLNRAADLLEGEKERWARLMTLEMGKPIRSAEAEAAKCAWVCRYYAENGERFLADQPVTTGAARSYLHFQPLGAVLAVMPWNFPFWQVFRFAAPTLMAGNVGLLKHASNVPQCALAIEEIFQRAGFPEGVFQTLLIGAEAVPALIADPRVAAVTLTGSLPAGRQVAAQAGQHVKKSVLELGGSDAFIVMPSADLEEAVETAVRARLLNNGESCIAAKRFIVHAEVYPAFERRFVAKMEALKVGDPLDPATEVGPLATRDILVDLETQVQASTKMGARLLCGGRRIERPGFFYEPGVLVRVPKESPAYREEIFGPVASLFAVGSLDEAVRLANDTSFGLGASVWTDDPDEQARFIHEIEAGQVFVNGMVASDPRLPFGGVKQSGYGRELGEYGLREFVNVKTVWVR